MRMGYRRVKTILFVILDQYADWEAAYLASAIHMLSEGAWQVKTVSLNKDPVVSIGGFHVIPDYDIHAIPADYVALVLIGGMTWRDKNARQMKTLVDRCLTENKVLGGICDASAFLGMVGALNHSRHTSNELDELKQWAGDAYTNEDSYVMEQAVRDGNVVTANGTAALEFAKEVLLALKLAPDDEIIGWYNFNKLGFYEATMPKM